uniref:Uncharacterized protein n=1 Tax=Vespula pensylvanica TaxID=30213 RepID=A0A834KEV4_VESPE|nr:hypothetical protein H0235_015165 [Vespula pensylvanica]
MAVTTNFNETNMALRKKRREEEEEEEEEDGEEEIEKKEKKEEEDEEEKVEEKEKKEEVQDKGKDYEPTLVYDSIDDRFYLDNNDSKDKFNSNQNDVDV